MIGVGVCVLMCDENSYCISWLLFEIIWIWWNSFEVMYVGEAGTYKVIVGRSDLLSYHGLWKNCLWSIVLSGLRCHWTICNGDEGSEWNITVIVIVTAANFIRISNWNSGGNSKGHSGGGAYCCAFGNDCDGCCCGPPITIVGLCVIYYYPQWCYINIEHT